MKFLIAAGGTGGHITPGIAIANKLKELGNEVIFLGTSTGMETDLVPKAGYDLKIIRAKGLIRGFSLKNIEISVYNKKNKTPANNSTKKIISAINMYFFILFNFLYTMLL